MEDNIETQETAIGGDGDHGIQSTSSPTQMKDLETLLPSPLRHQIAKVGARSNNPYFDKVQKWQNPTHQSDAVTKVHPCRQRDNER
jgi:hypothetical protein